MEFIIALALGAAAGAGVMYVKNSSKTKDSDLTQREVDRLGVELKTQQQKRSALEKENLELQQEVIDLKRKASRTDDETMDLEDDLEDERVKVSKQDREIDRLKQLVNEYKDALQACELELKNWKNKD